MRTTVTLDSALVNSLQKASQSKSKARAVVLAIEDYLRRRRVAQIKGLKGKMKFKLSSDEIRHAQR